MDLSLEWRVDGEGCQVYPKYGLRMENGGALLPQRKNQDAITKRKGIDCKHMGNILYISGSQSVAPIPTSAFPGNLWECKSSGPIPVLLNQKLWEKNPITYALTHPPGNSDTHSSPKTITLHYWFSNYATCYKHLGNS